MKQITIADLRTVLELDKAATQGRWTGHRAHEGYEVFSPFGPVTTDAGMSADDVTLITAYRNEAPGVAIALLEAWSEKCHEDYNDEDMSVSTRDLWVARGVWSGGWDEETAITDDGQWLLSGAWREENDRTADT